MESRPEKAGVGNFRITLRAFFEVAFQDLAFSLIKLVGGVSYDLLKTQMVATLQGRSMKFVSNEPVSLTDWISSYHTPMTNVTGEHMVNSSEQLIRGQSPGLVSLDLGVC
jgi:hypothetical protein